MNNSSVEWKCMGRANRPFALVVSKNHTPIELRERFYCVDKGLRECLSADGGDAFANIREPRRVARRDILGSFQRDIHGIYTVGNLVLAPL